MSIPKQIIEAEAEADKELETMSAAQQNGARIEVEGREDPPTNEVVPSAPQPTAPQQSADRPTVERGIVSNSLNDRGNEELDALRAENQRMKSEWGRMSKAYKENDELRKEVAKMRNEMDELRAAREHNDIPTSGDLTDRLRAKLGDGYDDDQINSFADAVREVVGDATKEFKTKFNQFEEQRSSNAKSEFMANIRREFPGFLEMDDANDPRLLEFYGLPISSVSDDTYGDIAKRASATLDYRSLARIIKSFAAKYDIVFSPNGTASVQQNVRPDAHAAARNFSTAAQRFARSEVEAFRHAVFAKKAERLYGLSAQQIAQQLSAIEEAEAYGNIDENR